MMALQDLFNYWTYFGTHMLDVGWSPVTLDALSEYYAVILHAPKTGTIDRIHFNVNGITSAGDGLRLRVETVNSSTGFSTGTLVGGSSEVSHTPAGTGWQRHTGALGAAVTRGDWIAIKITNPAAGTPWSGSIRRNHGGGGWPSNSWPNLVFYRDEATPTPAKGDFTYSPCFALEYSDGTCPMIPFVSPDESASGFSGNVDSNPDEFGGLFTMPYTGRVSHFVTMIDLDGTCTFVVYDESNNVVGQSLELTSGNRLYTYHESCFVAAATPFVLNAGATYRVVVKPSTTTSVAIYKRVLNTSVGGTRLREAYTGVGQNFKWTQRVDAGSWTDTDDSFADIGFLFDQLDVGGSSTAPTIAQVIRVIGG